VSIFEADDAGCLVESVRVDDVRGCVAGEEAAGEGEEVEEETSAPPWSRPRAEDAGASMPSGGRAGRTRPGGVFADDMPDDEWFSI
jgi:hypothetical protein